METIPYGYIIEAKFALAMFGGFLHLEAEKWLGIDTRGPAIQQLYKDCFPLLLSLLWLAICVTPVFIKFESMFSENWKYATYILDLFLLILSYCTICELPSLGINEEYKKGD